MTPGIYQMSAAEYHADPCPSPSLSSSIAKVLVTQSPHHAETRHPRLNPSHTEDESSRLDIGKAAHLMLLENDDSIVAVIEADDWRTKAAKEKREEARAAGRLPVLARHFADISEMVNVAREFIETTELAGIFENGEPEQTVIWQEQGIWCRARPDWLMPDNRIILDYKTCANAAPEAFQRHIGAMHYDLQAAFYKRGLEAVGGPEDALFIFLAQEIEPPYSCTLHTLSSPFVAIANEKVRQAIEIWQECTASGQWPAYTNRICCAEPPNWMINQFMLAMEQRESA